MNKNILVFTGAGVSAASGIPTFRDKGGIWAKYDMDKVCDYTTWKSHGDLVHDFHNQLRLALPTYQPNAAHMAIAQWQRDYSNRVTVFTQNVDDLLERAGCQNIIKLHGDLQHMKCTQCHHVWPVGISSWTYRTDACVKCGSKKAVKPGTVFFYEHAPEYARLSMALRDISEHTLTVVIGTSGQVVDIGSMLFDKPGPKILNNLESSLAINDQLFDHVFYESAHTASVAISQLVNQHMQS
jgi:NAD-dependent deacetylase